MLFESLSSELKFYQNVIADLTQFFKLLHEFAVHYIKTENEDIFYKFLYNFLLKKFKILWKYLNDVFAKEWIKHNLNFVDALILFIFKKNDELRLCVNYWKLNWKTNKNHYALSLINKTLNCLMNVI